MVSGVIITIERGTLKVFHMYDSVGVLRFAEVSYFTVCATVFLAVQNL